MVSHCPHRCPPPLSLTLKAREVAHVSVSFRGKVRLLDSPGATHFRDGASAADQLSLTNESPASLQGQQAYLERLEKSRNKISSKMKILFGHLWMVLLYFLSVRLFLLIALTF